MEIKRVGVVGCGAMGAGITQVCAQSGYQVVASEISDTLLNKGLTSISNFLAKSVAKGKLSEQDKDATLARIEGTTDTKDFLQFSSVGANDVTVKVPGFYSQCFPGEKMPPGVRCPKTCKV